MLFIAEAAETLWQESWLAYILLKNKTINIEFNGKRQTIYLRENSSVLRKSGWKGGQNATTTEKVCI